MTKSGETEEKIEQKESRKKNHLDRQRFTRDELNVLWRMATTTATTVTKGIVTTTTTTSIVTIATTIAITTTVTVTTTTVTTTAIVKTTTSSRTTATNLQTVRPHEKEGILRI